DFIRQSTHVRESIHTAEQTPAFREFPLSHVRMTVYTSWTGADHDLQCPTRARAWGLLTWLADVVSSESVCFRCARAQMRAGGLQVEIMQAYVRAQASTSPITP